MTITAIASIALLPASRLGRNYYRLETTVNMSGESASYAIADLLPVNAEPVAISVNLPLGAGGTTSVKYGVGTAANPSKYFLSTDKSAGEQSKNLNSSALTAPETLGIYALDNSGSAAGTIGGAGISAVIQLAYFIKGIV